jgi:putative restriction endonuclease
MTNAVFYHKIGSVYDDVTGKQYHFPKQYLSRVEQTVDDWVIYYGPIPHNKGRYYSGVARVTHLEQDPVKADHYYAYLADYLDFDSMVNYVDHGGYEKKLVMPDGSINGGRSVQAVRLIEQIEFQSIINAGLTTPDEWPERTDDNGGAKAAHTYGFDDNVQSDYQAEIAIPFERKIVSQLVNRPFRDTKFRQNIRRVYDRTCSFTGLRLINGGGRPEVEAAHIVPVEKGGNDSIQNGIALSGTVHWMFDRGLLGLANDMTILRSRHLNHDISHMLNRDMRARVPTEARYRPHPEYISWHRENIFKG